MQHNSNTMLCWDIYPLICKWEWKLIPKLMRTCRTLYNRLKPQLNIVAATIPATMYEQVKYVREVLVPKMMQDHEEDWFGHNLYKLRCNPIHLKVGKHDSDESWLDFIDSDNKCLQEVVGEEKKFVLSSTIVIKAYLEKGYQLLFWDRIKCLQWRLITEQQKEDIVMRLFYHDLCTLIGCNVKEYLVKHPILDAETNRNVHIYLDPDHTAIHTTNPDVYGTLVHFLYRFYYRTGTDLVVDVPKVLEKMTEPYWLLM